MLLILLLVKMSSFDVVDSLVFVIVNVTVSVATILINIFFICCMFSSQERPESLQKPPLNILLGSLIGCNLIINIANIFFVMAKAVPMPELIYIILRVGAFYAVRASFADCLGLNVFYYFQIVPARRPFLIWVKTHIKLFIYLMLFFANVYILIGILWKVIVYQYLYPSVSYNLSTSWNNTTDYPEDYYDESGYYLYYLFFTEILLIFVYSLVGLGIMVASNTFTIIYLWRHVKRMQDSSSFSALYYQKQRRVTILSIIQTLLFFIYSAWLITYETNILSMCLHLNDPHPIIFSIVAFYSFGTTIILGIGQTKFRVRAVEILKKLQAVSGSNLDVDDRN